MAKVPDAEQALRGMVLSPGGVCPRRRCVKGIMLWLIGIPIPIIILLYLFVFR